MKRFFRFKIRRLKLVLYFESGKTAYEFLVHRHTLPHSLQFKSAS